MVSKIKKSRHEFCMNEEITYQYKDCSIMLTIYSWTNAIKKITVFIGKEDEMGSIAITNDFHAKHHPFFIHDCIKDYERFKTFVANRLNYRFDSTDIAEMLYKIIIQWAVKMKGV